jgi:hypothetical protein
VANDVDSGLRKTIAKMEMKPMTNAVPLREATADQRGAIRTLLDKFFDADEGASDDGWDDQEIAEEVNVPRVNVEQLREVAYGPIRVTPQEKLMRQDISTLRANIGSIKSMFDNGLEQRVFSKAS